MPINALVIAGLAGYDLMILAVVFLYIRTQPRMDRRQLIPGGIGLSAFAFHAFIFFDGALLLLHLATIGGILAIYFLAGAKEQEEPQNKPQGAV